MHSIVEKKVQPVYGLDISPDIVPGLKSVLKDFPHNINKSKNESLDDCPGINQPLLYFGSPASYSCVHSEDG